jgi:hypothetical protein
VIIVGYILDNCIIRIVRTGIIGAAVLDSSRAIGVLFVANLWNLTRNWPVSKDNLDDCYSSTQDMQAIKMGGPAKVGPCQRRGQAASTSQNRFFQ